MSERRPSEERTLLAPLPQRFGRYAAMLIMLLTLGVGQMWATDYYLRGLSSDNWDASDANKMAAGSNNIVWMSHATDEGWIDFLITAGTSYDTKYGKNSGDVYLGAPYTMSQGGENVWTANWSSGTYYYYFNTLTHVLTVYNTIEVKGELMSDGWSSTTAMTFQSGGSWKQTCSATLTAGEEYNFKIHANGTYTGYSSKVSCTNGTVEAENGNDGDNIQVTPTHGGTAVVVYHPEANGTIEVHCPYQISYDKGANGNEIGTIASGSKTWNASFTLSSSTFTRAGYTQDGWSTSDGGDKVYNLGGSYTANADVTLYPHWAENTYTVTISNDGHGTTSPSGAQSNVGQVTGIAISASNADNYEFVNWTITSGTGSFTSATSASTTFYPTGTATIQANFRSTATNSLTVNAGTHVTTVTGSVDPVTLGSSYAINATAFETGWEFDNWTASPAGNAAFANASSASTNVTISNGSVTVTANAKETAYTITIVGGTAASTMAKVATTGSATANPPFGKYFINWTVPESNFSFAGGTSATDATITFNATADGTVTANFGDLYAFVEGRFRIFDAATNKTPTYTATDNGYWGESSLTIPFSYDNTNHQFYLSTYATPKQLADELSSNEQYFYIKTSSSDDDLTDVHIYRPASGTTDAYKKLTTAGGKLNAPKDPAGSSHSYWFDSSDDTGYAKLHFDGSKIWYSLEQTLQYDGNGSDGGSAPASKTYYDKGATAKAASNSYTKSGYTFTGWNTAPGGGGTSYAANANITMNSNITLYAQWQENQYNTTVEISPDGSGTTSPSVGTVAIKQVTGTSIEATKGTNTVFEDWSVTGGGLTMVSGSTTNPNTFKATSTGGTIRANFTSQWTVAGSMYNTWAWDKTSNLLTDYETISTKTYAYVTMSDLDPNTSYTLKVKDRNEDQDHGWYGIPNESEDDIYYADGDTYKDVTNETGNQDIVLHTAAAGDYIFKFNVTDKKLAIEYPTSWYITSGVMTEYNDGGSSDATETGGTFTAVDNSSNNVKGGKFVANGASVTFEAGEKDGYTFDAWYTNEGCTTGKTTTNPLTVSSIDADVTRYAKFTENMTTVNLSATNGKIQYWTGSAWADAPSSESVGVHTTCSIKAVPNSGYYFAGWVKTEGSDYSITGSFESESNNNTTLSGKGGGSASGQTLTANFVELDKIYFRNLSTMEGGAWANVYVYFGVTWNEYENAVSNSNAAYKVAMTQIGSSDVYWAYVPRSFTTSAGTAIAFSNQSVDTGTAINTGEAATRGDYNKALQMYVPSVAWVAHGANYHNDGYWKNYPVKAATGAGYYLQTTRGVNLVEFTGQADNLDIIECIVRVDQSDEDKTFHIISAGGIYFEPYNYSTSEYPKITSTASTMTMKSDDTDGLKVTLTSEGDYKFIIDQSSDVMVLTVVYPIGVGDYRIIHSYDDSGTKYAYSDIIKSSDSHPTVSMFYNPSSATMVLQKCTLVNASGPKWNEGTAIDRTKLNKGAGVYQFDLTISADAGTIDDGADLYDGPFYIKTDCAPGSWANYTQNVMDKNTINPTAFDYYFMKWLDLDTDNNEKKNIKCVIANQYNNAISDTLKSDGIATMVDGEPVLDNDGSVRFSYNSKTNALERAYLTGASNLTLETYAEGYITNDGGSEDQHGKHPGFVDDVLWTYELTVDAKLGAKAGVRAVWVNKAGTSKEQTLIENDNPIISGTGSGTYKMRLVFDFKTNTLISSWTPSSEITDKLKDVDVMLVREGQEASNVITFGTGGTLEPRKLVGSLKFEKSTYFGRVASWNPATRPLLTFFVSFPFDVKVNDVFGLNSAYGDAYVIRRYAGDERAAKGFFRGDGTTSFWKDLTTEDTMNAYEGYIVVLDNDYFNSDAYSLWGGKSELYLYFPSSKGGTISAGSKTIPVPAHPCGIDRTFDGGKNHMNTDSHWNLIGVPVFTTYDDNNSPAAGTPGAIFADTEGEADAFNYFYEWNSSGNDFAISSAKDYAFKAMHGYMVQYHGDVTFTGSVFTPASVAARRTVEKKNYDIELQVLNNEAEMLNRTYVALRDGASSEFVLNEDVYLSPNNRDAEIYTFAGEYDVAANRLPVENQLVQMGLNVHKAGNYTISMPSTFSGTATLVDTYTNTRTNLAIDEYEVNLPQGTCEDRFLLELNIHKVPTAIDGVDGGSLKDGNAHKFIMNDRMYILKNGVIYDACGNRVQ